jgi:biotin carboxyl carrier protein
MRYVAKFTGDADPTPVDIEPLSEGRYAVTLNGRRHEVDALSLPQGAVGMLIDGESFSVEFEDRGDEVGVLVRNQVTVIDVADDRRLRLRAGAAQFKVEGKQVVCAPMPGKLVKLLVKVGDEVKEGQGLAVVEAMKMENELKSPKTGKVVELPVKEGSAVENNARLVVVE